MKILIVVAHPDDEVLGCGGTVARLVKEGNEAFTLILGEGITARDEKRERKKRENDIKQLKKHMHKANAIIGIKEVFVYDFLDNRFDAVPLLDIVKVIESIKSNVKPDIVYTHHYSDLNIDHRITYNAVLTACRPVEGETVKEIYSFEVPSSTGWNYPIDFSPDIFFDISKTINLKLKAMGQYRTEMKNFPHPRSPEGIKINAQYWGIRAGLNCAETFKVIRIIK